MKLHEVAPRLYIRGRFDKACWSTERKMQELDAANITTVVNVSPRADFDLWMRMGSLQYIWQAMSDGKRLDEERILALGKDLAERHRQGESLLVHCNAGQNRSALTAAVTLRELTGQSGYSAIEQVRTARPNALTNQVFVAFLEGLK